MATTRVVANPVVPDETDLTQLDHYQCRLFRKGRQVDVYLSVQHEIGSLTLPDVLFMLAMDASGCRMVERLAEHRDEWPILFGGSDGNLREIEAFWDEAQKRCTQSRKFKNFLGDSVYEELLQCFDRKDPLGGIADILSSCV